MDLTVNATPEEVAEATGVALSDIEVDRVSLVPTIDGMLWWDWAHSVLEMPLPPTIETTRAIIRGDRKMADAQKFTRRHGFKSYRFNGESQRKMELREVHVNVNIWAHNGATVTFDDEAGRISVGPSDGHRPFYYEGRKSA
ncbi:hypothetical protein [Streptomyces sp. NPDC057363]|uniref:hypothetical protein n=1 Tax=Streptomyces sp. NPDC057363 TaxID=3346107 RepID=UPI0036434AAE